MYSSNSRHSATHHTHLHDKAKNGTQAVKRLILFCKPYLVAILVALVFGAISTIFNVIAPDRLADITNFIVEGLSGVINVEAIVKICVFLIAVYILCWIFSYGQSYIMVTVTQRLIKALRNNISMKINRLPLKYFDKISYGDLLSRVTNDVDTIGMTLTNSITTFVMSVTTLLGVLVMMLITNVVLTIAALLATLFGIALMGLIVARSQKYFLALQQDLGAIDGHIEEIYSSHEIVVAYNGEDIAKRKFDSINKTLYSDIWKSQFLSGLMAPVMHLIGNLGYVIVCVIGAVLTAKGSISFGVIVSFMIYVRLFTEPLHQLSHAFNHIQSTIAASERVFEFLDEEEISDESFKSETLNAANVLGNVSFSNIRFGYNSEKVVINNFTINIKQGMRVAIVGPTGAGKTTIVNLLMRFYEPDSGQILIDGVAANKLTRTNVHNLFCMVLQDTWLFEGTLRENIVYTEENISDAQLDKICEAIGLNQLVNTLPNGYDTIINDRVSLSEGQRQLVAIARAMLRNAPILILDEATSSIDTNTEMVVKNAMELLKEGKTSFIIAHRLSTIKNADIIVVMRNGEIVESGLHEELLSRKGFYAELYNSQFEN